MQLHQHHVAAGGVAGPLLRDVDVRAGVSPAGRLRRGRAAVEFRPDEAETLLRALEDADDLVLFPAGVDFAPAAWTFAPASPAVPAACTRWLAP